MQQREPEQSSVEPVPSRMLLEGLSIREPVQPRMILGGLLIREPVQPLFREQTLQVEQPRWLTLALEELRFAARRQEPDPQLQQEARSGEIQAHYRSTEEDHRR